MAVIIGIVCSRKIIPVLKIKENEIILEKGYLISSSPKTITPYVELEENYERRKVNKIPQYAIISNRWTPLSQEEAATKMFLNATKDILSTFNINVDLCDLLLFPIRNTERFNITEIISNTSKAIDVLISIYNNTQKSNGGANNGNAFKKEFWEKMSVYVESIV